METRGSFAFCQGFFFRAALRALCVRALAPTRKDDFRNFRYTSTYFQWGPVRGVAVWFQQSGNRRFI